MTRAQLTRCAVLVSAFAAVGLFGPAAALASTHGATPVFGLFGVDVGKLVGDVVKSLFDFIVPDFASKWASQLIGWLVAVPDVTNASQFRNLNEFRKQLIGVGFGLTALGFVVASLQYLAAGLTGRMNAVDSFKRSAFVAGALVSYPQVMGAGILATNLLTRAIVTQPNVVTGIDTAIGAAFVLAAVTGGFTLGMAIAAGLACLYFLASIFVIKIALTAVVAILYVAGALVLPMHTVPSLSWLPRLWGSAMVAVLVIPVAWALIFAVAALLTSDSLIFNHGLGANLEAAVKPFAAVACFYLAAKTPAFLLTCARSMGVNFGGMMPHGGGGGGGVGGLGRLAGGATGGGPGQVARRALQTHADRMRGLRAVIASRTGGGAPALAGSVRRGGSAAPTSSAPKPAGPVAPSAAADASTSTGPLKRVTEGARGAGKVARGAGRGVARVAQGARRANDWWQQLPVDGRQQRLAAQQRSIHR